MIIVRNIGDQIFTIENGNYEFWKTLINYIKNLATVFLNYGYGCCWYIY